MALNGFDISEFKATVLKNGLLKNSLYLVNFQAAAGLPNNLMFYTDSVTIPTVDLDSMQVARYGYGPVEQIPFRPVFTPLTMEFMVDASQDNVMNAVINSMSRTVSFMNYKNMSDTSNAKIYGGAAGNNTKTSPYPYEVAYKGDYEFTLQVFVYNENQDKILVYNFLKCYCRELGSVTLGWGTNDSLLRVTVRFDYTDFSIVGQDVNSTDGIDQTVSTVQTQLGFSSLSQLANALQQPQQNLSGPVNYFNQFHFT